MAQIVLYAPYYVGAEADEKETQLIKRIWAKNIERRLVMDYKELSMDIIGLCVNRLRKAGLTKQQFISAMCDIYMRTILGYCKAENLDPLETLTLFHQAAEAISLKGHEEAKKEMEHKKI
jgi:hypothetical protein